MILSSIKDIVTFLLQPLLRLRRDSSDGQELFDYLYYPREGIESRVIAAINDDTNVTIIGNPGHGKSCLMHFVVSKLQREHNIFPIILDYNETTPRGKLAYLAEFVSQLREYFKIVKRPVTELTEPTRMENAEDHLKVVTDHLRGIPKEELHKVKLVIFLDDLDYAEDIYLDILENYFLEYAASDKAIVILSVRKPLYNELRSHKKLRRNYYIQPKEIKLPIGDLELVINNRLKTLVKASDNHSFSYMILKPFRRKNVDERLVELLQRKRLIDKTDDVHIMLPFDSAFYARLAEITNYDLRMVEEMFPSVLEYELSSERPKFSDDFWAAFIKVASRMGNDYVLLDLVTEKTKGLKEVHKGNSILQNVLEYFYYEEVRDEQFYKYMSDYGISRDQADVAVKVLIDPPFNMLEPEYIYSYSRDMRLHEKFMINRKGIIYVQIILRIDHYYSTKRANSAELLKSRRSFYDDVESNKIYL